MSDFSGFDPKIYSDEELLNRVVELGRKMMYAYRTGNSAVVDQLRSQQFAIQMEQRERAFNSSFGNRILNGPSVVVESDPDLAAAHRAAREAEAAKQVAPSRSRPKPIAITRRGERLRPTSHPTKDDE